mgnify:CR=1 FL=1
MKPQTEFDWEMVWRGAAWVTLAYAVGRLLWVGTL